MFYGRLSAVARKILRSPLGPEKIAADPGGQLYSCHNRDSASLAAMSEIASFRLLVYWGRSGGGGACPGVLGVAGGEGEGLPPHNKLDHKAQSDVFMIRTRKSQDIQCPQKIISVPVNMVGLTRRREIVRTGPMETLGCLCI